MSFREVPLCILAAGLRAALTSPRSASEEVQLIYEIKVLLIYEFLTRNVSYNDVYDDKTKKTLKRDVEAGLIS